MNTLDKLRKKINEIDAAIKELFINRMQVSTDVGELKLSTNDTIYHLTREKEIIEKFLSGIDEREKPYAECFYKNLLNMSRARQYMVLSENNASFPLSEQINNASEQSPVIDTLCYQGIGGSWSSRAAERMYPQATAFTCSHFDDVFEAVSKGKAQVGILPIDNSTAGSVNDVYDLLVSNNLYITKAVTINIDNCLLGTEDAELCAIKRVYSHPQALMQCSGNLKKMQIEPMPESNTAVAAKRVYELGDKTVGAVASREAADTFGLKILRKDINDSEYNRTRFLAVSKQLVVSHDYNRLSLAFSLPNTSGALHTALLVFAANNINLTKIVSRPIPNRPWEYVFYIDCDINHGESRVFSALMQLANELSWVKLLGCYSEEKAD